MKQYEFKIIIREGNDEFWEDINNRKVTGCEEVTEALKQALWSQGFDPEGEDNDGDVLTLVSYNNVR